MSKGLRNSYDKTYKIIPDAKSLQEHPEAVASTSTPVHVQRAQRALDLSGFLQTYNKSLMLSSDSDDSDDTPNLNDPNIEALLRESESTSTRDYYNFKTVSAQRKWLADVLQENSDNIPEDVQYKNITKVHMYQKHLRNSKENFQNSMYYGAGLVSSTDQYPEIEKTIPVKVHKKKPPKEERIKSPLYPQEILDDISNEPCLDLTLENGIEFQQLDEDSNVNSDFGSAIHSVSSTSTQSTKKKKAKKFKDEESRKKWEDMMTLKRQKLFTSIVKKEISKQHRAKMTRHKEMLMMCKRAAQQCSKQRRAEALISARTVKEQPWRMKRLARENTAYWKRSRRLDREVKKRLEKEAEEQRKIDHEMVEAKRQQRKLNFLITQTELYAHFMSKKLGTASPEEQLRILSQLDEDKTSKLAIDDYDSDAMKEKAKRNAHEAFQNEKARTKHFDVQANASLVDDLDSIDGEQPQPNIFRGKLKGYQLRGMNWLANLYSQGISGILADEMGLGKTVQSIAFLCHIAEKYSVWGPFLIISPASTLHNWQQEIAKFVPDFKVVPYWGNPNERKILRQFWDQKDIYTKDASFHIVITSYQIVITDIKYFNRIKWQYMILDEAQAIKSTSSMRWKTLLGFSCRNRLLLSGTPIQNSMAELWALLHFIMPTLFDSHEEFNEWFSKDIESHAENKTGIDEKHLSRLHMILKPFMLRRIKKDVENELSDKIEVMVYCPLTTRQKLLYLALKQKIKIEDLLHYTVGGGDSHAVDKNFTSNLMNLVMQFRKVCNHPELFERRDAKSPILFNPYNYSIPYLVYDANIRKESALIILKHLAFTPSYIAKSDWFSLCLAIGLSIREVYDILQGDILTRWKSYFQMQQRDYLMHHRNTWAQSKNESPNLMISHSFRLNQAQIDSSDVLKDLVFTRASTGKSVVYAHLTHNFYAMPETVEHKNIRMKHSAIIEDLEPIIDVVNEESSENPISKPGGIQDEDKNPVQVFETQRTEIPRFLFSNIPKIVSAPVQLYCYSRRTVNDWTRFLDDYSFNSLKWYWSQATGMDINYKPAQFIYPRATSPLEIIRPVNGFSHITIPDKETLVTDSGKLTVLDRLLRRLKEEGHRVLIYSQMTKMIDLLEEYMWHRHHKYMRLDGSSKISERRDMVADFQARTDIFVFLLSTRAGGLGINLTAADTVIFYDSDWNPTVDQQAMDRAHRLGQTKQVTVYRLICKGTIEERILQRAREKSEIQKLVISGGNFKPDTLKPKEVVSLLLDDDELVQKYHLKVEGGAKATEDPKESQDKKRKAGAQYKTISAGPEPKRPKIDYSTSQDATMFDEQWIAGAAADSGPNSPGSLNSPEQLPDDLSDHIGIDDWDSPITNKYTVYNIHGSAVKQRSTGRGSSRRGRPRGSRTRTTGINRYSGPPPPGPPPPVAPPSPIFGIELPAEDADALSDTSVTATCSSTAPNSSTASPPSPNMFMEVSGGGGGGSGPSVRRGPGRPRLKPTGPANAGTRGTYRPRKPSRPLPVPLPSDGSNANHAAGSAATGTTAASNYPSYSFYDFPDQTDA